MSTFVRHRKALGISILKTNQLAESKIRKERELGEMLRKMDRQAQGRPEKKGIDSIPFSKPTLTELGMTKMHASRYQRESKVGDEKFEEWIKQRNAAELDLTSDGLLGLYKKLHPAQHKPSGEIR